MYSDPLEEVTLQTTVAWYLPFGLSRFINPIVCRISDVLCNASMETTVPNFPKVSFLAIVDVSAPSS
jgi:hypothetical protein